MCWGTLVAAEFLAGTTGIGFVENVAKKYFPIRSNLDHNLYYGNAWFII
jgi:ABC-type nitrate/sulfonate/bicarbonate transport system permease component